jgi:ABC-2 type transport system permease protein
VHTASHPRYQANSSTISTDQPPSMNAIRDFRVLAAANLRSLRGKARRNLTESRLLSYTLLGFLAAYQIVAYLIFRYGLGYLAQMPGIGFMLIERVHHLLYFLFFMMLACSNCVLLYAGIFRVKETGWLLTLPLNQRSVFLWKVMEAFLISSWGVIILAAPMLLAFGSVFQAPATYYFKAVGLYLPYLLLPSALAGIAVVCLVRYWGKAMQSLAWIAAAFLIAYSFVGWKATQRVLEAKSPGSTSQALGEILGHTSMAAHPLLPSTWVSEQLFLWMRGFQGHTWFHAGLITSCSLLALWLCAEVFSRFTFNCWVRSQERKASNTRETPQGDPQAITQAATAGAFRKNPLEYLGLSREDAALMKKDVREFTRDPTQWIPFAVIFALLLLYRLNLRRYDTDGATAYWTAIVRHLDFGVCALVVSTLTTRFIYPIYSLEGRRLWILGLAPIDLRKVFWLKLFLYTLVIAGASGGLMLLTGIQERLPWNEIMRFVSGILLLGFGMTSLSLGLGVLFPNYQETNPAKIVSSYGGTLCLIVNFLYILLFLAIFVIPGVAPQIIKVSPWKERFAAWSWLDLPAVCLLTCFLSGGVIFLAIKQIKQLEHLRKL